MPDKKLTDNEIVKALECCGALDKGCQKCLYNETFGSICIHFLCKDTLDLINRQKAEIERLERHTKMHDEIKAEAYKECIDKIQNQIKNNNAISAEWLRGFLDNLLKEIIGE